MATTAQIEANRRPSSKDQFSTGPRTPQGKARSSQNALKHGLRAQAVLDAQFTILGENPADFAALLQALADDLRPVGAIEEMCVESIALGLWRHRRVLLAEMGSIAYGQNHMLVGHDNPAEQARVSLPDFTVLDRLMRYENHLTRQIQWHLIKLTQLQGYRHLKAQNDEQQAAKRRKDEDLASAIARYTAIIRDAKARSQSSAEARPPSAQAASPAASPSPAVHAVHSAPISPNEASPRPTEEPAAILPNKPNSLPTHQPAPVAPNEPIAPRTQLMEVEASAGDDRKSSIQRRFRGKSVIALRSSSPSTAG